uniref:Glycosyltransferase n=1 Tax=Desulfobacca acetoxidans TaxID=60893 RepID=A0A7V4LCF0_9BACT
MEPLKTLVFAPAAYNLAETTRLVEIAGACREHFRVVFFSYGGEFERLVSEAGFPLVRLQPRLTPEKIERLNHILRWEFLWHPFGVDHLTMRVKGELAWFRALRPVAAVTGLELSLPISCRVAGVPLVWVAQTTWTRPYYEAGLGLWPDFISVPPLTCLPRRLLDRWARHLVHFNRVVMVRFNATARIFGVKPFRSTEFWEGDYTLLAEPPEFAGLEELPPTFHYVGPIIARLPGEVPAEVANLPRDLPVLYFAMGSSGNPHIVARLLEGFAGRPYRVIAPVQGLLKGLKVRIPPNVMVTPWLPAHKVNPLADLAVTHGGLGTVMTACLSGTPIVGIGMHFEQENNLECLVRKGIALRIPKSQATPAAVAMVDPSLKAAAETATPQVAAAVITTALLVPVLTAYVANRNKKKLRSV